MITWMQKKKKYLIVTIWISTIAFVGAGFVGWGSYDFKQKGGVVAQVGDIEITAKELQVTYSNIYNQFNQQLGGKLDQELAKQFKLEDQAIQALITQALMLNLANSYDLTVSKKELQNAILTNPAFAKNGKFDKAIYQEALKNSFTNERDYEESLKKQLRIQKLSNVFDIAPSKLEIDTISTAFYIADKLEYKVLDKNDVKLDLSENALKTFWQGKQTDYLTQEKYKLQVITQKPAKQTFTDAEIESFYSENNFKFKDSEGKIKPLAAAKQEVIKELNKKATKKDALKTYIALKKNVADASLIKEYELSMNNAILSDDIMQELTLLGKNDTLKPRENKENFVIVKLLDKVVPAPKSFESAKEAVRADYIVAQTKTALEKLAQDSLTSFKGKKTGFITREDITALKTLSPSQAANFLNELFSQTQKEGFINVEDKMVLYRVLEQKLLDKKSEDNILVSDTTKNIKRALLDAGMFEKLQQQFPVELFYKGQ